MQRPAAALARTAPPRASESDRGPNSPVWGPNPKPVLRDGLYRSPHLIAAPGSTRSSPTGGGDSGAKPPSVQ